MDSTKTTLYLPADLHRRLKSAAGRRGTTLSRLIIEGAEWILARDRGGVDRAELARRAHEAAERMRAGLYDGPVESGSIDEALYGPGSLGAAAE